MSTDADKPLTADRAEIPATRDSGDTEQAFVMECAKAGQANGISIFLDRGYNANLQDAEGLTALHHAAARGARACIRVLVASGKCDYLLKDKRGRFPSQLAIAYGRDVAIARLLAKHERQQARERGLLAWWQGDV